MRRAKVGLAVVSVAILMLFVWESARIWGPKGGDSGVAGGSLQAEEVEIRGTVRDESGRGIAGATVSQGRSPYAAEGSFHRTMTKEDGSYVMKHVKVGEERVVAATAAGYSPAIVEGGEVAAGGAVVDMVLEAGHTLRLRFVDVHGKPVSNVAAEPVRWRGYDVLRTEVANDMAGLGGARRSLVSDENGEIVWDSAPGDAVDFLYESVDQGVPYQRGFGSYKAGKKAIEIVMKDAFGIRATVTDARTHQAIPKFRFFIGNGETGEKVTDWDTGHGGEAGAIRYRDAEPFEYAFVRVEAPGYAPVVKCAPRAKGEGLFSFEMSEAGIRATVVTAENEPVENATVYAVTHAFRFEDLDVDQVIKGWHSPDEPPFQKTGADGSVLLADPGNGAERVVVVAEEGFAEVSASVLRKEGRIVLEPWASLTLHVHEGQKALKKATMVAEAKLAGTADAPEVVFHYAVKTSETGDVTLERVPPREMSIVYLMEAASTGVGTEGMEVPLRTLTPKGEETVDLGLDVSGQAVAGRLVRPAGVSVNGTCFTLGRIGMPPAPPLFTARELAEMREVPEGEARANWVTAFAKSHPERAAAYEKGREAWWAAHPGKTAYFVANPDGTFLARNVTAGARTLRIRLVEVATGKAVADYRVDFTVPEKVSAEAMQLREISGKAPEQQLWGVEN